MYKKEPSLNVPHWSSIKATTYGCYKIRGNDMNDIFVCGAYGEVLHFNGVSWKSYIDQTGYDGYYNSVAFKNNLVIAVGAHAQIAVGKRN